MVHKVRMPKIDANVEEGTIGGWLVEVGGKVEAGTALVEIITDKATFELEAEQGGILRGRVAAEKSVVPVGYVIALLTDTEDEVLPDVTDENKETVRRHLENMLLSADGAPAPDESPPDQEGHARATPAARRLARREDVSLDQIEAPEGKPIQESDVAAYLRSRDAAKEGGPHAQ